MSHLAFITAAIAMGMETDHRKLDLAARIGRDFDRGDDLEAREERIRQAEAKRERKRMKRRGVRRES